MKPNKPDETYIKIEINYDILNLVNDFIYAGFLGNVHYRINSKREYMNASNEWLSKHFKISIRSVTRMIQDLIEMDLISVDYTRRFNKNERRIKLTEKALKYYNKKITKEKMENLDESIFSDKPVEQKPLKGKSLIIPENNLSKEDEDFNKLRKEYFQPKIYNKKKELKAYLELTPVERILAYQNLKAYLELQQDNPQYIVSLQNYLLDKKFSNENIDYLNRVKNKVKKSSDDAPIKENQWDDFK